MPFVVLTYCHKRLFLDSLCLCVCLCWQTSLTKALHPYQILTKAPSPFLPPALEVQYGNKEMFLVRVVFCTQSVYLAWFVTEKVKWKKKPLWVFFFLLFSFLSLLLLLFFCAHACFSVLTAICNLRPLDHGAHVVPKTRCIRSCKHTFDCVTPHPPHPPNPHTLNLTHAHQVTSSNCIYIFFCYQHMQRWPSV